MRAAAAVAGLMLLPATADAKTSRIVGGNVAAEGAYPAQAYVEITGLMGTFQCGGTLVARTKVVTAAHCVDQSEVSGPPLTGTVLPMAVQVRLGSNTAGAGTLHAVSAVDMDPAYDATSAANDAAVLTLADTADQPALPLADPATDAASYEVGDPARVIGWGDTSDGGMTSDVLREVDVPIVSDASCGAAYDGFRGDVQICAGYPEGGRDSCQGDSGGPLMTPSAGVLKLVGVVSTGDGCAQPGKPGIYTELVAPAVRDFIVAQVGAPPTAQIDPIADLDPGTSVPVHVGVTGAEPTSIAWDLDEDGSFDDATGPDATWTPSRSGTREVRAIVTDADGRRAAVARSAQVRAPATNPGTTTPTPAPVPTTPAVPPATTPGATTTPPSTPKPKTPSKTAAKGKAKLAIASKIVKGRLRVSGRVTNGTCRGAKVALTVKRGSKRVARRTVTLKSCRFTVHFSVRGKLKVSANYSFSKKKLRTVS